MAETRQGIPLPESRHRQDWRTGSQVSRGGKLVDVEIIGAEMNNVEVLDNLVADDLTVTDDLAVGDDMTVGGNASVTGYITTATVGSSIVPEAWSTPTMLNSWVNYGGGYQTARYRKTPDGTVHIQGLIAGGTVTGGTTVFVLPAGYRPAATLIFESHSAAGTARTDIDSSGNVKTSLNWSASYTMMEFVFSI